MEHLGLGAVAELADVVVVRKRQEPFLVPDPEDDVILRRREYVDILVATRRAPSMRRARTSRARSGS